LHYNVIFFRFFSRAGEVPEWLNGAVSKTVERFSRSEGSNPSLSANVLCLYTEKPEGWEVLFKNILKNKLGFAEAQKGEFTVRAELILALHEL
jgi:hypothetical protein